MAGLTTHVLDLTRGRPASGLLVELFAQAEAAPLGQRIAQARTNADGRCDAPLLEPDAIMVGRYRLVFHVADYFREQGVELPDPPFLDVVTIDFGVSDTCLHHHVPLLVSPYGYSTYRGS